MISYTDSEGHAARTAVTRAVITDFARLFYVERDVRTAFETFVAPGYIQHNPGYRTAATPRSGPWPRCSPIPISTPTSSGCSLTGITASSSCTATTVTSAVAPSWTCTGWPTERLVDTGHHPADPGNRVQ